MRRGDQRSGTSYGYEIVAQRCKLGIVTAEITQIATTRNKAQRAATDSGGSGGGFAKSQNFGLQVASAVG